MSLIQRAFSATVNPADYKKQHSPLVVDPKFYENDFMLTSIEEIEFIRSPFYDYAKAKVYGGEATE
jgi:hypothetical protein